MIEPVKELMANTETAIRDWNLGPMVVDQQNDPYWQKAAEIWSVDVETAKQRICCNCEYYDDTPERLAEMLAVPLNQYDIYNSPYHRGYCYKLHIICHTTRSCQAWERKDFEVPDDSPVASRMYPTMR
jgi:hypothetical protein